jgi:hypothetical protein
MCNERWRRSQTGRASQEAPSPTNPIASLAPMALAALLAIGFETPAFAHERPDRLIPEEPGGRISAAIATAWFGSSRPVPAPRLTGILGMGDTPDDQRGWRLEHGTVAAGIRASSSLGAVLALGWHDGEPAHVEAAWLELRESPGSSLAIGVGRNRIPLGTPIADAGHFDHYGQTPLAKRAAFSGDWIGDGVSLSWRPHFEDTFSWVDQVDLGVWDARRFPGSESASLAAVLRLRASWGAIAVDGFYAHLRARGRGAYVQRTNSGHVHTAPRCNSSLRDITCFDGDVDLFGASIEWDTPLEGLDLAAAGVLRREDGGLYSQNGDTRYRGRSSGGWLDVLWRPSDRWVVGLRQEWLRGEHRLSGPGAALVAADAGLLPNAASRRLTAMAGWQLAANWRASIEAGRERIAGGSATVIGLRLLWTPDSLVQWNW